MPSKAHQPNSATVVAPEQIRLRQEEDSSCAKVSRKQCSYLQDFARHFEAGLVNPSWFSYQTDQHLITQLPPPGFLADRPPVGVLWHQVDTETALVACLTRPGS